jgi:hypothetical protein
LLLIFTTRATDYLVEKQGIFELSTGYQTRPATPAGRAGGRLDDPPPRGFENPNLFVSGVVAAALDCPP